MAFSSSSVPTQQWTYDVFLNFRGTDSRQTFVDHLYTSLVQRGLRVFQEEQRFVKGKLIPSEPLKAIEESKSAVVVFSKNYANSTWCLTELSKIIECHDQMGMEVFPVFYFVDPSDVRGQRGDYATAFAQQEAKFRGEIDSVKKWRNALTAAANLSGFPISEESYSAFITDFVSQILRSIPPRCMEKNLIGIESHIDKLNKLLDMEKTKEVRMVGICGIAGMGKTTIAQTLFRKIAYKFVGCSFVKNVRENSVSKRDICYLQEKIIRDILLAHQGFMIPDPEYGAKIIKKMLCNKKILLVLDDVDDMQQLEFLAAKHEWFGPGSRIIVTTRDEHLLSGAYDKYKPDFLPMDQSVELFNRNAFGQNSPLMQYEILSESAINHTRGLPLALKVLGSFFHGRMPYVLESALNSLPKTPDWQIFETLKLSFNGLRDLEKEIFLDVACFFKGKDVEHVTRILDSFGFDPVKGIGVLVERSLLSVSNKKRLVMHDQIQEMGWKIIRDSNLNSRLWQLEEIHDIVKQKKKVEEIEGIVVQNKQYQVHEKLGFRDDVFESMKKLRLLAIQGKFTSYEPKILPKELRWLCWNQYPFSSLPLADTSWLVGLEMCVSNIEHLWIGKKIMSNLKFIHLQRLEYLKSFPDVSGAPNIERLSLTHCRSLVDVHETLGSHKRLVYIDMSDCWKLKYFSSFIEMESLETLILSGCSSLEAFPEVKSPMVKLSNIYLDGCSQIRELPLSIKYLPSLRFLNLTSCTLLQKIPNTISELKYLKSLHLHDCVELLSLPEDFGSMENLKELQLGFTDSYTALQRVPQSITFHTLVNLKLMRKLDLSWRQIRDKDFPKSLHDAFPSLERLNLSGNSELTKLPPSISHLSCLKHLELNECCRLQSLNSLPSGIQVLRASSCKSLEKIIDFPKKYEWLYKIWLVGCWKLLDDEENESYLNMMLQKSFLKKCAAVDHRLSIAIPGSHIPNWFNAKQHGCDVALKLPPKWHSQIIGFAVSGVFTRMWTMRHDYPVVKFTIVNDERSIPKTEFEYINDDASSLVEIDTLWFGYIPFSSFQHMHEDWSDMDGNLAISISLQTGQLPIRCGAHIVYKEDVEPFQQLTTSISDHCNVECVSRKGNRFIYEDEFRST